MLNDQDRERWQTAVDAAEFLLVISDGNELGLCTGLQVNRRKCQFVLRRGQQLGVIPQSLESRFAFLQRSSH